MGNHKRGQGPVWRLSQPAVTYETVIPNPKLKLLDQVREVMRLKHYSTRLLSPALLRSGREGGGNDS